VNLSCRKTVNVGCSKKKKWVALRRTSEGLDESSQYLWRGLPAVSHHSATPPHHLTLTSTLHRISEKPAAHHPPAAQTRRTERGPAGSKNHQRPSKKKSSIKKSATMVLIEGFVSLSAAACMVVWNVLAIKGVVAPENSDGCASSVSSSASSCTSAAFSSEEEQQEFEEQQQQQQHLLTVLHPETGSNRPRSLSEEDFESLEWPPKECVLGEEIGTLGCSGQKLLRVDGIGWVLTPARERFESDLETIVETSEDSCRSSPCSPPHLRLQEHERSSTLDLMVDPLVPSSVPAPLCRRPSAEDLSKNTRSPYQKDMIAQMLGNTMFSGVTKQRGASGEWDGFPTPPLTPFFDDLAGSPKSRCRSCSDSTEYYLEQKDTVCGAFTAAAVSAAPPAPAYDAPPVSTLGFASAADHATLQRSYAW
jgi:hypothetical protein